MKTKECFECGKSLFYQRRAYDLSVPVLESKLPVYPNPNITVTKEKILKFNDSLEELMNFAAWICGVEVEKLCTADMLFYIRKSGEARYPELFVKDEL